MSKISLCLIAGNVETYIRRCLESFRPIADEIVIVQAIGAAPPDATLDIAVREFGARTGIYRNTREHAEWPHVDDFAAARQMSFDLATGDYCFWCDTDDILEAGADRIRELAGRGDQTAWIFPYRIQGHGLMVPRERMILRNSGRWQFPVHECFKFNVEPVVAAHDESVIITHLPDRKKAGSNARNLRILESIPPDQMTTGLRYHQHVEYVIAGRMDDAVAAAKTCLADPELGRAERYEIHLNLNSATRDPNLRAAFLHQAYAADPTRREALGLLTNLAMNHGKKHDALAYASQMMATQPQGQVEWNDRPALYGWVGDDLYAQALRMNGYNAQAEQVRRDRLARAGGPTIALLHATRGRAEQAAACRKIWLDAAMWPERIEHIFVMDEDDPDAALLDRFHSLTIKPGGGCVAAWNTAATATVAPVLVQLSDDWLPPNHWDKLILDRLGDLGEPKVLAVSDGFRTDGLLTIAICTRPYYVLDQFLFHPGFQSVYSDDWFTEAAQARGCIIDARDLVFEHRHYLATGATPDATYLAQNAPERYAAGQQLLARLRAGKDWSAIPGFFNYIHFYAPIADWLQDGDEVVEVGCWLGRSIIYLAQELLRRGKTGVKLHVVDHFKGESNQKEHEATVRLAGGSIRATFEENCRRCGVDHLIQIHDGDSAERAADFPDGSLKFVWLDAAHDYERVRRDLAAWIPKIKKGGIFAGHDAQWPDVERAVKEAIPTANFMGCLWATKTP